MRHKKTSKLLGIEGSTRNSQYSPWRPTETVTLTTMSVRNQSDIVKGDHRTPLGYRAYFSYSKPGIYKRLSSTWNISGPWWIKPPAPSFILSSSVSNDKTALASFTTNSAVFNAAVNEMYRKLAAGKLEFGLELVQVRQTASMIANAIVDLSRLIDGIKSGRLNAAFRTTFKVYAGTHHSVTNRKKFKKWTQRLAKDTFANRWLELQFGVKPVIDTIETTINRLTDDTKWSKLIVYATGKIKRPFSQKTASGTYTKHEINGVHYVTVKQCVRVTDPLIRSLSSYGLGIRDMATILYEVIPYSFVLDWFVPVNKWIKAFAVQQGLVPHVGSFWTQFAVTVTATEEINDFYGINAYCNTIRSFLERRLTSGWPSATTSYKPDWLNAWTVATSAALLNQTLRR